MTPTQKDIDAATMWWLVNHEMPVPQNLIMAFARHAADRPLVAITHPMAAASLIEVLDYAALRLAGTKQDLDDMRELQNAVDRFDEAYMWAVAGLERAVEKGEAK